MIGTPITIKNHDNGAQIVLNDHDTDPLNVIALQSFPSFEREVRNNNTPKQGAHGEYRLPTYYSGISIVLQGIIVGETESDVWNIKNSFENVMQLSRKGKPRKYTGNDTFPPMWDNTVRLSFTTPNGKDVFVDATPVKEISYDRPLKQKYLLNFQVILRATSPYLFIIDDEPNVEAGTLGSLSYGFKLPTTLPFSLGEEHIEGEATITMTEPGFAIVTLNGSDDGVIINPTIHNLTNNTICKIQKPLAGSNRFFKIDGVYQEMVDENDISVIQYSTGDYIALDAGENVLLYTADAVIPN